LLVNTGWIVLGTAIAVAGLVLAASRFRRDQETDFGSVSHQWIAEHRAGQGYDPQR
jgi:hypothetical protein